MLSLPENVQTFAPWSISKVGVLEKCTLQFDFKYKQGKKETTRSEESDLGTSVHSVLETALKGIPIQDAFDAVVAEKKLTTDESERLMTFYEQIERFVAKMENWKQKYGVHSDHVLIERKWGLKSDFTNTDFFNKKGLFRGVVDYALITSGQDMIIIDHKSGKERPLDYYDAQFKSYCVMALAMYPWLKGIRTGINFVLTDKLVFNPYVTAETIRTQYREWMVEYLTKACEGLLSPPKPNKSKLCDWCGFKSICPAHGGNPSGQQETHNG